MYIAVGGRKVQSGIYRVTYTGSESTAPAKPRIEGAKERAERNAIAKYHLKSDASVIGKFWKPPWQRRPRPPLHRSDCHRKTSC